MKKKQAKAASKKARFDKYFAEQKKITCYRPGILASAIGGRMGLAYDFEYSHGFECNEDANILIYEGNKRIAFAKRKSAILASLLIIANELHELNRKEK